MLLWRDEDPCFTCSAADPCEPFGALLLALLCSRVSWAPVSKSSLGESQAVGVKKLFCLGCVTAWVCMKARRQAWLCIWGCFLNVSLKAWYGLRAEPPLLSLPAKKKI